MGTLTIRNLPEEVHDKLRLRAAKNRRSVEAEARALLSDAMNADEDKPRQAPFSSLGAMAGEIEIPDDWKELDREIEEMFEEAVNKPFDLGDR